MTKQKRKSENNDNDEEVKRLKVENNQLKDELKQRKEQESPLDAAVAEGKKEIAAALEKLLAAAVEEKADEISMQCEGTQQQCGEDYAYAEQVLEEKTRDIESEFQREIEYTQSDHDGALEDVAKRARMALW